MADQSQARYADVVATSQERDLAVIKVRTYQGPYLTAIDCGGTRARQGEPAALIGYPAGCRFARLPSSMVRRSMSAGSISRATEDVNQFAGMTLGGSSSSPAFTARREGIAGRVTQAHLCSLPSNAIFGRCSEGGVEKFDGAKHLSR